ncbi:hypothetical protein CENSYa_0796 [Cenarchaeum symbiosum A]|uniref:Uncharacterized protein n=1 Tax=Cenarchaeum symbiosum (strain A) TaxID=414004 RepID=A0RVR2_CENSY|nr:hypothetical protein CENSYa_0796 [Cenarchaeum symbiosum A]
MFHITGGIWRTPESEFKQYALVQQNMGLEGYTCDYGKSPPSDYHWLLCTVSGPPGVGKMACRDCLIKYRPIYVPDCMLES